MTHETVIDYECEAIVIDYEIEYLNKTKNELKHHKKSECHVGEHVMHHEEGDAAAAAVWEIASSAVKPADSQANFNAYKWHVKTKVIL